VSKIKMGKIYDFVQPNLTLIQVVQSYSKRVWVWVYLPIRCVIISLLIAIVSLIESKLNIFIIILFCNRKTYASKMFIFIGSFHLWAFHLLHIFIIKIVTFESLSSSSFKSVHLHQFLSLRQIYKQKNT